MLGWASRCVRSVCARRCREGGREHWPRACVGHPPIAHGVPSTECQHALALALASTVILRPSVAECVGSLQDRELCQVIVPVRCAFPAAVGAKQCVCMHTLLQPLRGRTHLRFMMQRISVVPSVSFA